MQCPSCGQAAPVAAKFCPECGQSLPLGCPGCGFAVAPTAKFCPECGRSVSGSRTDLSRQPAPPPPTSRPDWPTPSRADVPVQSPAPGGSGSDWARPEAVGPGWEGTRRQLTVMFCDLADSTALSVRLDPEDLADLLRRYHEACTRVIGRFDGHVARIVGDGLLVYFGYPTAHEDDAQRAARAGLALAEAIRHLDTRTRQEQGVRLAVRVGIHTGLVVVGEMRSGDHLDPMAVTGETPNVAARLQGLAEANGVVISAVTHRLVAGFIECQSMGMQPLKGLAEPIECFRALAESGARSRLEVRGGAGLTPLVGRDSEIQLIRERWAQAREGVGQVVVLSAEPGVGKSRLVQVIKDHVAEDPRAWLTPLQCSPYHQNSALYPIIDVLERVVLQFERGETSEQKLRKLEGWLAQHGLPLAEVVPLFASLLSLPLPDGYEPLRLSPEAERERTLQAILAVLLTRAAQQPLLLVVEDLQWVDPTTLELLGHIVTQVPIARMLVLMASRPEFAPPWLGRSHVTLVVLNRLPPTQLVEMVQRVAGDRQLPDEVLQQIVTKSDGVPLFAEEVTKMVLESGFLRAENGHYALTGPLPQLAIPTTLHDSLLARLDRLSTVKSVAQLAAAVGREFSYELIQAVWPYDETTLQRGLVELVAAELVYQRGLLPRSTYVFKHALVQDAAYQSLLKSTRQQFHQRIAQALIERFPELVATQPELIGHHFAEAGLPNQAVPYWQRAGERAGARSAHHEAIGHLRRGLALLGALPPTPERIEREIALQIALGVSLAATRGYGVPEVLQAYGRARELCQQLGDDDQLFPALYGLWRATLLRAEYRTARELGGDLLARAEAADDPSRRAELLVVAHRALGASSFYLGDLAGAREHVKQVAAAEPAHDQRERAFGYDVVDAWVACRAYLAWTLWLLGDADGALAADEHAIATAREIGHPFSLALALSFSTWLHQFRGDAAAVRQRADAALAISHEHGFAFWKGWNMVLRGWAMAELGQRDEGLAVIREGVPAWRSAGSELGRTYFLSLAARVFADAGQLDEAVTNLDAADAHAETTGESWWRAELHRQRGELALLNDPTQTAVAAASFKRARAVAVEQGAWALKQRAELSLARLDLAAQRV